jgi:hypothetical protein
LSQLLCLPHFVEYAKADISKPRSRTNVTLQLKALGRRVAHIAAILGHPEALFCNVTWFQQLYRHHASSEDYPFYRAALLALLRPMADNYPDTRVFANMIALELLPHGDFNQAQRLCLSGLERPTRPREYERILISAGRLLTDPTDAMKAFKLAVRLLMQHIHAPDPDPFPFATRQRLLYKIRSLEDLAKVLYERAESFHTDDVRVALKLRAEVLGMRRGLKAQMVSLGLQPGEEKNRLCTAKTLDDILYQLVDPEAVLHEEAMIKSGFPEDSEMIVEEMTSEQDDMGRWLVDPEAMLNEEMIKTDVLDDSGLVSEETMSAG